MSTELAQFDKVQAELKVFVQPALSLKVTDQESYEKAYAAGRTVKQFEKRIEEMRKALVNPLKAQAKAIDQYADKISEPLLSAEKHIKAQLKAWDDELEKKRQEENRRAEEERRRIAAAAAEEARAKREEAETLKMFGSGEQAEIANAEAAAIEERGETEQLEFQKQTAANVASMKVFGSSKKWTFEITDPTAVPREYLCIDEKKIRQAIREGVREIPGVEIFQEKSISIR